MAIAAFKVLNDKAAAEDIVQDIFLDLWRKRHELSIENTSSYLFSAVKYRVLNYIRKNKVPMTDLDFVDKFNTLNSTEEFIDFKELRQTLDDAISDLPDQCRKVFTMSRFDHMSNKEIAEKLNLSLRTVENHISLALRKLRPKLKDSLYLLFIMAQLMK